MVVVLTRSISLVLWGVHSLLQRGTPLTPEAARLVLSVLSTALAGMSDATSQVSRYLADALVSSLQVAEQQ